MTKLQILNQYLTERLMVVVREILEVVGDTVSEYQEETTRTQRENECLRRRLREVVFDAETAWSGSAQPIALAVSGGMSPIEQQCCEEEWRTSEGQDTEPALTAEKQELADQQRTRLRKGELDRPDSVCVAETESECVTPGLKKLALEIAMSVVSPSLNVNSELNVIHIAEDTVAKMPSFNTAEPESLPSLRPDQVKTEPGEVDLKTEQSSEQVLIIKTQGDAVEAPYEAATNVASKTNGAGLRHTEESKVVEAEAKADEAPIDNYLVGYSGEKHCFHCGKFFSQACNLKAHLQIHTGERPYTCNWCGKSFTQSADLRRHQRIHTGEKPHRCTWCEKSFTQIGNLKRHLRIHTGERPYSCNMCGKAFNDGDTLKKHKRVHTGERPFRCIYCPKTFTVASSLQNHLKNHTRDSKPQHTMANRTGISLFHNSKPPSAQHALATSRPT